MSAEPRRPEREDDTPAGGENKGDAPEPAAADEAASAGDAVAALEAVSGRYPFGPRFFLSQLRAFACQDCPDPRTALPVVELHLVSGDVLDLCYVMGVTPTWVALAVHDKLRGKDAPLLRTEFLPYERIVRITLRGARPEAPLIGFEHRRRPEVFHDHGTGRMSPEESLRAAAADHAGHGDRPEDAGDAR